MLRQALVLHVYGANMHEREWRLVLALSPNLAYLTKVIDCGSFTAAAAELKMTPSTLSRSIRRLEHDIGIELAVRHGRAAELTPAGLLLAQQARVAVNQVRTGLREAALASARPVIRIGLLRSLGSEYVPTVVGTFAGEHPGVQFSFREASGTRLAQMLVDREIDIALIAPPPEMAEVVATVLFEQTIDVVVSNQSRWAREQSVDLAALADENFILSERGYDARAVADKLFETAGFRPKVILETDDMAMAVGLAAASMGVALAPPTPEALGHVTRVSLNDPRARRHVAVCRLKEASSVPLVSDFVQHVIQHSKETKST